MIHIFADMSKKYNAAKFRNTDWDSIIKTTTETTSWNEVNLYMGKKPEKDQTALTKSLLNMRNLFI